MSKFIKRLFSGSVVSALTLSQIACVAPPQYSDVVVLSEEAKHIQYALEDDVKSCEKFDVVVTGGAKAGEIKEAVNLAMMDARNQAVLLSANRLVYLDTKYTNFFGVNYVGIESGVYKCSIPTDVVAGYVNANANANATAEAKAQKQAAQAAAFAASQAAMHQAQMQAMMAAQHQQAMQQIQQQIQQNQQTINNFKF